MALTPALVSHCLELLAPLGTARCRRMFGGWGLYVDDLFVALIANERLYLKADDTTRADFEAAGCEPFAYSTRDRAQVTLGYWSAPDDAMDSPGAMQPWARRALASAVRAQAARRAPAAPKAEAPPRKTLARSARPRPPRTRG
jgi:DNA transformation protein